MYENQKAAGQLYFTIDEKHSAKLSLYMEARDIQPLKKKKKDLIIQIFKDQVLSKEKKKNQIVIILFDNAFCQKTIE